MILLMKKGILLLELLAFQIELIGAQKYLISDSVLNAKNLKKLLFAVGGTAGAAYVAKKLLGKFKGKKEFQSKDLIVNNQTNNKKTDSVNKQVSTANSLKAIDSLLTTNSYST